MTTLPTIEQRITAEPDDTRRAALRQLQYRLAATRTFIDRLRQQEHLLTTARDELLGETPPAVVLDGPGGESQVPAIEFDHSQEEPERWDGLS